MGGRREARWGYISMRMSDGVLQRSGGQRRTGEVLPAEYSRQNAHLSVQEVVEAWTDLEPAAGSSCLSQTVRFPILNHCSDRSMIFAPARLTLRRHLEDTSTGGATSTSQWRVGDDLCRSPDRDHISRVLVWMFRLFPVRKSAALEMAIRGDRTIAGQEVSQNRTGGFANEAASEPASPTSGITSTICDASLSVNSEIPALERGERPNSIQDHADRSRGAHGRVRVARPLGTPPDTVSPLMKLWVQSS